MRACFFLVIILWWPLLLLTSVSALMVGPLCRCKMAGITWQKSLITGLAGGFVGLACPMTCYWPTNLIPGSAATTVVHSMLPVPQRRQHIGHPPPLAASFPSSVVFTVGRNPATRMFHLPSCIMRQDEPAGEPGRLAIFAHIPNRHHVAHPVLGDNVPRLGGIVPQLAAQPVHHVP